MIFPKNFFWGSATSSFQIEGAVNDDGRGTSIWDQYCHDSGRITTKDNADIACNHYYRYREDIALMVEMRLQAYRFSISWPRILPEGTGKVEPRGLDFYDRLVDDLLANGITPWATLFHWDLPLALQRKGGWLSSDSPRWFADYAGIVANKLGDRVRHWITINEARIFGYFGHRVGIHAPGLHLALDDMALIIHHILCAHGMSVQALRSKASQVLQVGMAAAVAVDEVAIEFKNDQEVVEHARKSMFDIDQIEDFALYGSVWNDPVFLGHYPQKFISAYGHFLPQGWEQDLQVINTPLDFCGMNVYHSWARHLRDPQGRIIRLRPDQYGPGHPRTTINKTVTPEALYWGPRFFSERYKLPLVITENGMSGLDWIAPDGRIRDGHRISFMMAYLQALHRAISDGADVVGYFHWSLLDNFEWSEGYSKRFGLIHVDFETLQRRLKDSALWYRRVIESHGRILGQLESS